MFIYSGFIGSTFIQDAAEKSGGLVGQAGIWLGLNGMAIGSKRRITIEPRLVSSVLVRGTYIRHEKLIVEATLTESCVPVLLRVPVLIHHEVWCRRSDEPKLNPALNLPIWHLY